MQTQVGISRLVEEGAFNAAFPLHDVRTNTLNNSIIIFNSTCRAPTHILVTVSLTHNLMPDKFFTNSGPDGGSGESSPIYIIFYSILYVYHIIL